MGQGFLIVEASRSHSDTPHLVGQLWTSDQLVAEADNSTAHKKHKRGTSTNISALGGTRNRHPSNQEAAGLRPYRYRDRRLVSQAVAFERTCVVYSSRNPVFCSSRTHGCSLTCLMILTWWRSSPIW